MADDIQEVEDQLQPEPPDLPNNTPWGAFFLGIWLVALIIFAIQNSDTVRVHFLWLDWDAPVAVLVIVTALATLVLTGLGSAIYRRRQRKRLERESGG